MPNITVENYTVSPTGRSVTLTGLPAVDKSKIVLIRETRTGRTVYRASAAPRATLSGKTLTLPSGVRITSEPLEILYEGAPVVEEADLKERDFQFNVKEFGAVGNGVADDTAAITAALAAGGITFFPAGVYLHTGITFPSGAHVRGAGFGNYTFLTPAPASQRSVLKLKNGTNGHNVTVPEAAAYGTIENIEINGNSANNTGSHYGLYFEPNSPSGECGWKVTNVEIHHVAGVGLFYGYGRMGALFERVLVTNSTEHGVWTDGSDTTWIKLMSGHNLWRAIVIGGGVQRFIGGDIWGPVTTDNASPSTGIVVTDGKAISLTGMGIDGHTGHGLTLSVDCSEILISGNIFHNNGLGATNTYSDIKVDTASGLVNVVGNDFSDLNAVSVKRKYAIETGGNPVTISGNTHKASGTGTSFTDDVTKAPIPSRVLAVRTSQLNLNTSTTETDVVTASIPAGTLQVGSTYRIRLRGTVQYQATSGTLTFKPYLGTNVAATTPQMATQGSAGGPFFFYLESDLVVRSGGASGTYLATSLGRVSTTDLAMNGSAVGNTAVVNTTAAVTIKMTAIWATSSATNILKVETASIEQIA